MDNVKEGDTVTIDSQEFNGEVGVTSNPMVVTKNSVGSTGLVPLSTSAPRLPSTRAQTEGSNIELLERLIASKSLPSHVKNIEIAFTIQQMGKELGFATMQSFHYILPIQGKLSLSAKAVGAVLRKGGVAFHTTEDCVNVYSNGTTIPSNAEDKPVDKRTTIEFFRDGLKETTSFTWREAQIQGLTSKDNWIKLPSAMMFARALSKGANRVGQDLLLGLYTTEELYDALGTKETKVTYGEDGFISHIE